jgi:hypothetical protein
MSMAKKPPPDAALPSAEKLMQTFRMSRDLVMFL